MSNYGREQGYIKLTKTGYLQVVRAFRKNYNDELAKAMRLVYCLHDELTAIKGAGSSAKRVARFDEKMSHNGIITGTSRSFGCAYDTVLELGSDMVDLIRAEMFRGKNGALTKPRASAFPKYTNKQVEFSVDCNGYGGFTFDGHGIDWNIPEGNRSWESARECLGYRALSQTLNDYKWKRGEGGRFKRLDEYDIDAGNGWQVVASFGPHGNAMDDADNKAFAALVRAMR